MKKLLYFISLYLTINVIACPMNNIQEENVNDQLRKLYPNYSSQQIQNIIDQLNNLRVALIGTNIGDKQLQNIVDTIIKSKQPEVIVNNPHIMNGITNAITTMDGVQFNNINVQNITINPQNNNITATVTGQILNGNRITNIIATDTEQKYDTTTTVRNDHNTQQVAVQLRKVTNIETRFVPNVTATTTLDTVKNKQVVIISNKKVHFQDAGQSIIINGIVKKK